ncbi:MULTISPECIES: bifunctional DNA-binding transcriptional regulator/O6-methylguanine-DNA methyltransferase Ada [Sphingomonas]|uniref:bifunctional DNA-binding transcriptional regulator/O6-methylguanine-DNA methyltransferase Ada n=1 Tax=Sphingomonas TaxID=13687 RepID=UPI000DEEE716|nr:MULTISPECIES: bifunctional DNA-binding transcriptional regulator/O6-methylguanine-DNA methyltransferase Ada [Sphingomonas]
MVDEQLAWQAFEERSRRFDGQFVGAVVTTGIYCRPSCPARRPKRENVRFFESGAEAAAAGFRACLRCRPDAVTRDEQAVAEAVALLDRAEEPLRLEPLAAQVGYAPHHFQRLFTRQIGLSPAAYARAVRRKRAEQALEETDTVTEAIYEAGYSAPSRFYEEAGSQLGMTPSAWRDGGRGETIRWAVADSAVGKLLVAVTDRGICRLTFDESVDALKRRFPNADLVHDPDAPLINAALAAVAEPARRHDLPLDVSGSAFQQRVWAELRKIPPGETRSYADIAAAVGQPGAVRAVGTANGANPVAVVVPCHRVVRSDGSLGGYAGGLDRKRQLLKAEGIELEAPTLL